MRGRYDNPSEASSLFLGRQLNSRASSKTAVSTPLEDFRASRYTRPDDLPQETTDGFSRDIYSKDAPLSRSIPGKIVRDTSQSQDPEPFGPYFSIHRKADPKPTITRRGTTKELIGKYETLSVSDSRSGTEKQPSSTPVVNTNSSENRLQEKRGKGRSPIRQSFRNLLSVFSKKSKTARDTSSHVSDLLHAPTDDHSSSDNVSVASSTVPDNPKTLLQVRNGGNRLSDEAVCTTPIPLYCGQLHYLCKPILPDGLPVWVNCDVALHHNHMLITWRSSSGNPSTSMVHLPQCTDVRSLSFDDLDPTEAKLLPAEPDYGESKVFELLFEGLAREKFAAVSVKERAGWVNAVWDVVLRASEQRTPSMRRPSLAVSDSAWEGNSSDGRSFLSPSIRSTKGRRTVSGERSLPPLPIATPTPSRLTDAAKIQLYDPPHSIATPPALTPDKSTFYRLPTPGRQSPSIRNLDQRSMVKQRLAEIERTSSASPSSSPVRSTRSRQVIPSPVDSNHPRQNILLRHGTISSIGQDSITDSYSGSRTGSPISPFAKRLASIPSGESIGNEESSWITRLSKLNVPENLDVFSPASRYSDGLPATQTRTPPPVLSIKTDFTKSPPPRLLDVHRRTPTTSSRTQDQPPIPPPKPSREASTASSVASDSQSASRSMLDAPSEPRSSTVVADLEHGARLSGIRKQLSEVQINLRGLPEALGAVVAENPPTVMPVLPTQDEEATRLLQSIDGTVKQVEDQGERNAQGLAGMHAKVDALMQLSQATRADSQSVAGQEAIGVMIAKLDELCCQMKIDIPTLSQRLEDLAAQKAAGPPLSDGPSSMSNEASTQPSSGQSEEDMSAVHNKLQEILSAIQAHGAVQSKDEGNIEAPTVNPVLEEVLSLVKADQAQREEQTTQQADSARYLNELNTWLETFVKHGTSQIETMAAGVQHLCQELGPTEALDVNGQPVPRDGTNGGLLSEIRQMLAEDKGRGDHIGALQMSIEGLMAAVQENMQTAEARGQFPADTMMALIEQQRQNQEHMLKTLTTELSNDIRGERLRFVEAMKEATTINVQIHVEEFKKELTREVLSMTQEVTRLQRERQTLEQQIADLFAFYAKQKQAAEASRKKGSSPQDVVPFQGPGSGRRPLPNISQPGYILGAM